MALKKCILISSMRISNAINEKSSALIALGALYTIQSQESACLCKREKPVLPVTSFNSINYLRLTTGNQPPTTAPTALMDGSTTPNPSISLSLLGLYLTIYYCLTT